MLENDPGFREGGLPSPSARIGLRLLKAIDPVEGGRLELQHEAAKRQFLTSLTLDGVTRFDDIPRLTLLELLKQFSLVYNFFPERTVNPFPPDMVAYDRFKTAGRGRIDSFEFTRLAIFLEGLLNVSPTTCGFDLHLMRACRIGYEYGVNGEEGDDTFRLMIKSQLADDGAFFNPRHAQDYERVYYRKLVEMNTEITSSLNSILGLSEEQRLVDRDLTQEEIDQKMGEMNAFVCELVGHPVDMERFFLLNTVEREVKNKRWIDGFYLVYNKGPSFEIPHTRLPSQELTEVELILARWRSDFIVKYGDEP